MIDSASFMFFLNLRRTKELCLLKSGRRVQLTSLGFAPFSPCRFSYHSIDCLLTTFRLITICFTPPLCTRSSSTSLSALCNLPTASLWTSNALAASKSPPCSATLPQSSSAPNAPPFCARFIPKHRVFLMHSDRCKKMILSSQNYLKETTFLSENKHKSMY